MGGGCEVPGGCPSAGEAGAGQDDRSAAASISELQQSRRVVGGIPDAALAPATAAGKALQALNADVRSILLPLFGDGAVLLPFVTEVFVCKRREGGKEGGTASEA